MGSQHSNVLRLCVCVRGPATLRTRLGGRWGSERPKPSTNWGWGYQHFKCSGNGWVSQHCVTPSILQICGGGWLSTLLPFAGMLSTFQVLHEFGEGSTPQVFYELGKRSVQDSVCTPNVERGYAEQSVCAHHGCGPLLSTSGAHTPSPNPTDKGWGCSTHGVHTEC